MKYLTRENPWYTAILIIAQLGIGVYLLLNDQLFLGGLLLFLAGINSVYLHNPEVAPDFM